MVKTLTSCFIIIFFIKVDWVSISEKYLFFQRKQNGWTRTLVINKIFSTVTGIYIPKILIKKSRWYVSKWKGFTSEQLKHVVYGREKHRVGRSKDEENREVKRKNERTMLLLRLISTSLPWMTLLRVWKLKPA